VNAHAGKFDVVTCMEMLEHVPEPGATLAVLARLTRPGGQIFISTISRNFKSFALAIVGAEYLARLVPRGTHEYDRLLKPRRWRGTRAPPASTWRISPASGTTPSASSAR
jgi:2-polyprenyl-6-hydroxyphenyl methylase/3-demethylubiquinone-9 3-methyltransferase